MNQRCCFNDSQWKALCWHHRSFCTCFSHLLGFKQVSKWGQREILDLMHPVGWDEPDGKKTCVVVHNKSFRHQLFIFPSRHRWHNRGSQVHGLQWLLTVPIANPFTRFKKKSISTKLHVIALCVTVTSNINSMAAIMWPNTVSLTLVLHLQTMLSEMKLGYRL